MADGAGGDAPKDLEVRLTELENAVRSLTEEIHGSRRGLRPAPGPEPTSFHVHYHRHHRGDASHPCACREGRPGVACACWEVRPGVACACWEVRPDVACACWEFRPDVACACWLRPDAPADPDAGDDRGDRPPSPA
jgi:hypothetical protein